MHDAESVFAEELERLAPTAAAARPDWTDVLARAGNDRRARRYGTLIAIAVAAIAAPAVALSSDVRGMLGLSHPTPLLRSAEPLVSAPVGNAFFAHLWRSRSTTGGVCLFSSYDHSASEAHVHRLWRGGGSCTEKGTVNVSAASATLPLAVSFGIQRRLDGDPRNWVPPVVAGAVYPKLHAARVAVVWRGGSHDLTLRGNWFIGGSRSFYVPPLRKFPFVVVAYDSAGRELARKKLESPSLLMLRHGWKEFAHKYNAWKRRR